MSAGHDSTSHTKVGQIKTSYYGNKPYGTLFQQKISWIVLVILILSMPGARSGPEVTARYQSIISIAPRMGGMSLES